MEDARYKEIMIGLGMQNSQSLLVALHQVANEVAQETMKKERESCALICDEEERDCRMRLEDHGKASVAYFCAVKIRNRF